jgi:hypothetical protein
LVDEIRKKKPKPPGLSPERMREISAGTRFGGPRDPRRKPIRELIFQHLEECIFRGAVWQREFQGYFRAEPDTLDTLKLKVRLLRQAVRTKDTFESGTASWALAQIQMAENLIKQNGPRPEGGYKPLNLPPAKIEPPTVAEPVRQKPEPTEQEILKTRERTFRARLRDSAFLNLEEYKKYIASRACGRIQRYVLPDKKVCYADMTLFSTDPWLVRESIAIAVSPRPSEQHVLQESEWLDWTLPAPPKKLEGRSYALPGENLNLYLDTPAAWVKAK